MCSNYLEGLDRDDEVQMFIRNAPSFHMPKNNAHPMLLIGPGEFLLFNFLNEIFLAQR